MNPALQHFLKLLLWAVVGAAVTAALSTFMAFLAANPAAFGSSTAIIAALVSTAYEFWVKEQPQLPATTSTTPQQ
jgi:hypothetical protein